MANKVKIKFKEINLVSALHNAQAYEAKQQKKGRPSWVAYVGAALIVLIAAGAFGWLLLQRSLLQLEYDEMMFGAGLQEMQENQTRYEQLVAKNEYLSELRLSTSQQMTALSGADSQYTYYKADMFQQLMRQYAGKITLTGFSLSDSALEFTYTATDALSVPEFVAKVRAANIFDTVAYDGWEVKTESGEAVFTLACGYFDVPTAETADTAETAEGGAE